MIFCFSGTGNSRYLANRIAEALFDTVIDLNTKIKANDHTPVQTDGKVIVVAPTYAWRIPRIVTAWLTETELLGAKRIWFVMNCGVEIGNAAKYNRQLARQKGMCDMGTVQILMPENYIAMFRVPQAEEARTIVQNAEPSLREAIACIQAGRSFSPPRNNLYDRLVSGPVNPAFYRLLVKANAFPGQGRMHRLRKMRSELSHEQHSAQGQTSCLGQGMHPLHGLYLLLPRGGH